MKEKCLTDKKEEKPLEILNIGCTGSGKTRFILSAVLSKEALKNFVPALTSLWETTACSILYHINLTGVIHLLELILEFL